MSQNADCGRRKAVASCELASGEGRNSREKKARGGDLWLSAAICLCGGFVAVFKAATSGRGLGRWRRLADSLQPRRLRESINRDSTTAAVPVAALEAGRA